MVSGWLSQEILYSFLSSKNQKPRIELPVWWSKELSVAPDHNIWRLEEDRGTRNNLPASSKAHGEGNGTPLQYSCLENPMDGGAWWAAVLGVAKSRTWLSDFTFTFHFHALEKKMATHSSVLAWRIPGTGEDGGLPPMGVAQSRTRLKRLSSSSNKDHKNLQPDKWAWPNLFPKARGLTWAGRRRRSFAFSRETQVPRNTCCYWLWGPWVEIPWTTWSPHKALASLLIPPVPEFPITFGHKGTVKFQQIFERNLQHKTQRPKQSGKRHPEEADNTQR